MIDQQFVPSVYYYRVHEPSSLLQAIQEYHELCSEFISHAEDLVHDYQASSAVLGCDTRGLKVVGLNFERTPPRHWIASELGSWSPREELIQAHDFQDRLCPFHVFYHKEFRTVRFGPLGNVMIASLAPDEDSKAQPLDDADLLKGKALALLKISAPAKNRAHIDSFSQLDWLPAPFLTATVFSQANPVLHIPETKFRAPPQRNLQKLLERFAERAPTHAAVLNFPRSKTRDPRPS